MVQENSKRGVPRKLIEKQKEEIYTAAARSAKERVKLAFLVQHIAEQERSQCHAGGGFAARAVAGGGVSDSRTSSSRICRSATASTSLATSSHEKVLNFWRWNTESRNVPAAKARNGIRAVSFDREQQVRQLTNWLTRRTGSVLNLTDRGRSRKIVAVHENFQRCFDFFSPRSSRPHAQTNLDMRTAAQATDVIAIASSRRWRTT